MSCLVRLHSRLVLGSGLCDMSDSARSIFKLTGFLLTITDLGNKATGGARVCGWRSVAIEVGRAVGRQDSACNGRKRKDGAAHVDDVVLVFEANDVEDEKIICKCLQEVGVVEARLLELRGAVKNGM